MKPLDLSVLLEVPKLSDYLERVERKLLETTATVDANMQGPLRQLVTAKSKRLRSAILLAILDNQSKTIDDKAISSCAAIELVHLGSLVHDDIIDKSNTRWGKPTVNKKHGIEKAILIGDYLFGQANVLAASIDLDVAGIIASTIVDICEAESMELANVYNMDRTIDQLLIVMRKKTASLFSASCQIGGICSHLSRASINTLHEYGEAFGMSFQLIDDVLDIASTDKLLGKPVGNDLREGVYTMPIILLLNSNEKKLIQKTIKNKSSHSLEVIKKLSLSSGTLSSTIEKARNFNDQAVSSLRDNKEFELLPGLANLPEEFLNWSLDNLVDDTLNL